jgi:hypothetical protein
VKKLIGMIATVAVVLSMGVTALASQIDNRPSPDPEEEAERKFQASIVGHDDWCVDIDESWYISNMPDGWDDEKNTAEFFEVTVWKEVQEKNDSGDGYTYKYLTGKDLANEVGKYEIAFVYENADYDVNDFVGAYLYNDAGQWIELDAKIVDGKIVVSTVDDGYIMFVFEPADDAADDAAAADDKAADNTKKSAATGYNSTAYIVCAIALAAGAAFFFGTSKKSAKEMM